MLGTRRSPYADSPAARPYSCAPTVWLPVHSNRLAAEEQGPDGFDFVAIHAVSHIWIDALVNDAVEPAEHVGRLMDARQRDVGIDVAASKEHRGPRERS